MQSISKNYYTDKFQLIVAPRSWTPPPPQAATLALDLNKLRYLGTIFVLPQRFYIAEYDTEYSRLSKVTRDMIDATRKWLRRNRTTFAIGFGLAGITYVTGQYVLTKIAEARERMTGDRIAKENLRRRFQQNQDDCTITVLELLPTVTEAILEALPSEKLAEEIQQKKSQKPGKSAAVSDVAASDFSSTSASAVADEDGKSLSSFRSGSYIHASQMTASSSDTGASQPSKSKSQLWADLKLSSITRSFTLLYTVSLLSLLTRIQLNILGRRNYLSSVVSLASHSPSDPTIGLEDRDDDSVKQAYGNDFETNRKFLTFSWWLLHRGWREIMGDVEAAVREVFGPHKPTEDVSLEQMSNWILAVRRKVEGASPEERSSRKWLSFLLPLQDEEQVVLSEAGVSGSSATQNATRSPHPESMPSPPASPMSKPTTPLPLRRLLDETADLIDSPMFTHVLTLLLDASFSQLADIKLRSKAYKLSPFAPESSPDARVMDVTDSDPANAYTKLATVLAFMTREAHKIGSEVPNEYVQAIEAVSELEGFAAVVYSSNFEIDGVIEPSASLDTSKTESNNFTAVKGKETSVDESNESPQVQEDHGIIDKATSVADAAFGGFESVWSKVTGR